MMKLGTLVDVLDVRNHATIHLHVMIDLRASLGSKKRLSLENDNGVYNIALRYRAGK
jgi:hypothetical protein